MAEEPDLRRLGAADPRTRRRFLVRSLLVNVAWITALVTAYYVAPWSGAWDTGIAVRVALSLSLVVILTGLAIPYVSRGPYPLVRAVAALSFVIVMAVVSFASTYALLSSNDAEAFSEPLSRTDALYFSVTTATTVGFGDISPTSEVARVIVMIHMIANVVVIGVAVRVIPGAARRQRDER